MMKADKRKQPRIAGANPVKIQKRGSQRYVHGLTRDLSDSGIGFLSESFFPLSTGLVFETLNPSTGEIFKKTGEIAWVTRQPYSDRYYAGARFTN